MKRTMIVVVVFAICATAAASAQAPPPPGPEHQKLGAFVGNWTFNGELKPGVMGPGGKITGTDRITWMPGNYFIERRNEGKMAGADMKGLEVMGYDAAKKVYTFNYFDSMGTLGSGTITVTGNTWNATGTASMGGVSMRERCALTFGAGNTTLTIKCEASTDGGAKWGPTIEGVATKSK